METMNQSASRSTPPDEGSDLYREVFAHSPVGMVFVDSRLNIVACNTAAGRLLRIDRPGVVGLPAAELVTTQRRAELERLLHAAAVRKLTGQLDLRLEPGEDNPRDLRLVISPVIVREPRKPYILICVLEETGRAELSQRLLEAEKMASLGTLAGGVAHHFNNILGGVATFVDFALASGDPTSMRRALEMTAEAATRVSEMTGSLLSFTARDRDRADLADLTEIVLTFAHLAERPLKERGIELKLDFEPMPVYEVQTQRINQILHNLLANAEEALTDGGTIRIHLQRKPMDVVLTFADTGVGMNQEVAAKAFEPFYTTKGLLAGGNKHNPGLGLSVVHGIVRRLGGSISVDSTPGEGTKFTIRLPLPPEKQESPATE